MESTRLFRDLWWAVQTEKAEWLITPDTPPMKCFLDVWECYSLNEITIYWNSPAIFVAAFLDADIV